LAKNLAHLLNVPWGGGVLVCVPLQNTEYVKNVLTQNHIRCSVRGNGIRFSTDLSTTESDILQVSQLMQPFLGKGKGEMQPISTNTISPKIRNTEEDHQPTFRNSKL